MPVRSEHVLRPPPLFGSDRRVAGADGGLILVELELLLLLLLLVL